MSDETISAPCGGYGCSQVINELDSTSRELLDEARRQIKEWRKAAEAICNLLGPELEYDSLTDLSLTAMITLRIAESQIITMPLCPPHFGLIEKHPKDYEGRCIQCERNKFAEQLREIKEWKPLAEIAAVLDDLEYRENTWREGLVDPPNEGDALYFRDCAETMRNAIIALRRAQSLISGDPSTNCH